MSLTIGEPTVPGAELGSTFTEEGGPYEWVKMSFGRFHAAIAAVFCGVTNPLWVGGSLAFVAGDAWASTKLPALQIGELGRAAAPPTPSASF